MAEFNPYAGCNGVLTMSAEWEEKDGKKRWQAHINFNDSPVDHVVEELILMSKDYIRCAFRNARPVDTPKEEQ